MKMHLTSMLGKGRKREIYEFDILPHEKGKPYVMSSEYRRYQDLFVKDWLNFKYLLAVSPTGSGKSILIMAYLAKRRAQGLNTIILVPKWQLILKLFGF